MSFEIEPLNENGGGLVENRRRENLLDLDAEQVIEAFKDYGLVLFRGFEPGVEGFGQFTSQFTSRFAVQANPRRIPITADGATQTVQVDREGIPFHGEMHYWPRISPDFGPPDIIWFYCESPPRERGETTVCEGVRALAGLSEATRNLFLQKRLKYQHRTPAQAWQLLVNSRDDLLRLVNLFESVNNCRFNEQDDFLWDYHTSAVKKTRHGQQDAFINSMLPYAPFYSVCFEDGSEIPKEVMAEVVEVTDRLTIPLRWQAGDLAMIDNSRCMHGRHSNDEQRRVLVRMSLANF